MLPELKAENLRKTVDPKSLGIKNTSSIDQLKGIIGQKRAVTALKFGLQIDGRGYNVYVAGKPGTGKMTSVQSFLEELASEKETPPDWCYVNNFNDPYNPKVIQLPPGRGCDFQADMNNLVEHIQNELPKVFESEEYNSKREEILSGIKKERDSISKEINDLAREKGFNLQPTAMGVVFVPLKEDGQQMKEQELQSLEESERAELDKRREELQSEIQSLSKKMRKLEKDAQGKVKELDQQVALNLVEGRIEDLKEKYEKYKKVVKFLDEVQEDIIENVDAFKAEAVQSGSAASGQGGGGQAAGLPFPAPQQQMTMKKYQVNVLVDNSKQEGAPVITEFNPTYNNLFGRIEKEMQMGALNTDFTMIKPGSLAKANGGFLVVAVEDLLTNIYSYDGLKRALKSGELQIEELGERLGFLATKSLRPQPIPLEVKVVIVGPPLIYHLLYSYDPDFPELFKVKADYDTQMSYNNENIDDFLGFISTYCEKEKLNHLNSSATAKILEQAMRMADDQEKISTEFGNLSDLIRESNFWAKQEGKDIISANHVKQALDQKIYRSNLIEEKVREMIERGVILIDLDEAQIGQVNGLSVLSLGDYEFGRPSRITATVGPGRDGIVDIEREVKLGGPIHSKGVLILSGYLAKKYARGRPLTLAARLVFEQSYQGVEGDSASAAELFAILSALSEIPIKQGISVTGSLNQQGEIQAIGGINQKVEGFFDVCKVKGLTGNQGVLMPASNVKNLMLREDVVNAVESGEFHIWAVKTIDEGIEILTGKTAGERQSDGSFPKDSINKRVESRLEEFEKALRPHQEKKEEV